MDLKTVSDAVRSFLPKKPCGAVIVAAGTASRMGGIDKVMAALGGEPMIARTVRAFQNHDLISEIIIVTRPDLIQPITELCKDFGKVQAVIAGGSSRQESVGLGLASMSKSMDYVAVHDGARPLITPEVIERAVRAAFSYNAAAPGVPVKDTIKVVQGGIAESTPDRSTLRAIQTPQVFDFDLLRGALKKAEKDGAAVTDDCSAVELTGMNVRIVEGDERNIKVTTPMDLKIAEMLLEEMA